VINSAGAIRGSRARRARSTPPLGRIRRRTPVGPAAGAPGILAVLTGRDATADGLQPIPHRPVPTNPHEVPLKSRDGSPFFTAPHPVLALGKTRYVGEPVAVVVAETSGLPWTRCSVPHLE
jgi:aerobic carbon-monoxide dehydrogenase large subunit